MPGHVDLLPVARKHGRNPLAYSTLDRRLQRVLVQGKEGYLAYRSAGRTSFGLEGPVCARGDVAAFVEAFREEARRRRKRTAFFASYPDTARMLGKLGYRTYRAARDPWIELGSFTLRGNRMMNVRGGYNRARNAGLGWREYRPSEAREPELEAECDGISAEWLGTKGGLEIEFILGRLDWDIIGDRRFFVASSNGRIEGFLVFQPVYNGNGWYLDMSRRRAGSPNGTMDLLLVEAIRTFNEEGRERVYLGMIPDIAFPEGLKGSGPIVKMVVKALAERAEFFYPVRSETFFKEKYHPQWEDLFLCTDREVSLGLLHDLLRAFQPRGVIGMLGRRLR